MPELTQDPASATILPQGRQAGRRGPAQNVKDWADEEAMEDKGRSVRGFTGQPPSTPEDHIAGTGYKLLNCDWPVDPTLPRWINPENGHKYRVSIYYPTCPLIIDYPASVQARDEKAEIFASVKMPYIAIMPGQPVSVEKAQAEVRKQTGDFEDMDADLAKDIKKLSTAKPATPKPAAKPKAAAKPSRAKKGRHV